MLRRSIFHRLSITAVALLAGGSANAARADSADQWDLTLGAGAISMPEYPGGDEQKTRLLPVVTAKYGRFLIGGETQGIGVNLIEKKRLARGRLRLVRSVRDTQGVRRPRTTARPRRRGRHDTGRGIRQLHMGLAHGERQDQHRRGRERVGHRRDAGAQRALEPHRPPHADRRAAPDLGQQGVHADRVRNRPDAGNALRSCAIRSRWRRFQPRFAVGRALSSRRALGRRHHGDGGAAPRRREGQSHCSRRDAEFDRRFRDLSFLTPLGQCRKPSDPLPGPERI